MRFDLHTCRPLVATGSNRVGVEVRGSSPITRGVRCCVLSASASGLGLGERADPSRGCGAVGEPNEPGLRGLPRLVAGALGPRLSAWRTFCVPRFSRSRSREPYRATRKESRVDLGKRCAARVAGPAAVSVEWCPRPASRRVDGAWSACLGRRLHAPG
jgi:hypothetical protein